MKENLKLSLRLVGLKLDEESPNIAVYQIDASGQIERKVTAAKEGVIEVSPELTKHARGVIALGPDVEDPTTLPREALLQLRLVDHLPQWEKTKVIDIAREWWVRWRLFRVCLSGRVRWCRPFLLQRFDVAVARRLPAPELPFQPRICVPICNGVVEIYERVCCCRPPIIIDLPGIIDKIRRVIEIPPVIVFPPPPPNGLRPPGPGPDPAPLDRVALRSLKKAQALGELSPLAKPKTELLTDLRALQTLPQVDALHYFQERAYLWPFWCSCSSHKIGETVLGPDGSFNFCFIHWPILLFNCSVRYYYKVRQWQDTRWVYIYDGALAGQYFQAGDFADLATFFGRTCGQDPPPVSQDRPFVMLQDIGSTHSHRLVSHYMGKNLAGVDQTQTGEFSLAPPVPNGGLVDPPYDAPWGAGLSFRLYFHPGMKALGAQFYRLSVVAADVNGSPSGGGSPEPITNAVSWLKFVFQGGQWQVVGETLGPIDPNSVGGQVGLYKIPYDADALWLGGQFHQFIDTTLYGNRRNLIVVEVFDAAGNRLRPTGAVGVGTDKNFYFLRWLEEIGPDSTATVPFAALTHLFWFDNRPVYADIEDLKVDHAPNNQECQFLSGSAATLFSVGFRAFHAALADPLPPPQTFMDSFRLYYHRGLSGSPVLFQTGNANQPPTLLGGPNSESVPLAFSSMLGNNAIGAKCTFAVNLDVHCKHTNGFGRLSGYDRYDEAAFALEITV